MCCVVFVFHTSPRCYTIFINIYIRICIRKLTTLLCVRVIPCLADAQGFFFFFEHGSRTVFGTDRDECLMFSMHVRCACYDNDDNNDDRCLTIFSHFINTLGIYYY